MVILPTRLLVFVLYGCAALSIIAADARATDATGGEIVVADGYLIHSFTSNGVFAVSNAIDVEILLVAGGGGGAGTSAGGRGGGGAGGVVFTNFSISPGNYNVTVGQGGSGGAPGNNSGANGEPSIFETFTAIGGGGGGHLHTDGKDGGSGGGGGASYGSGGAGIDGQGYAGGTAVTGGGASGGGGGGVGSPNSGNTGGDGGPGIASDFSGSVVWYAGGGGGGSYQNAGPSSGGVGGGGNGSQQNTPVGNGVANTGGGGGGAGDGGPGGNGGSGIVLLRYVPPPGDLEVIAVSADPVGPFEATAKGALLGIGGEVNPGVVICWGTADAGTASTNDWQQVTYLGNDRGAYEAISHGLAPLESGTDYFYRFYATNSTGDSAWSDVQSLTTQVTGGDLSVVDGYFVHVFTNSGFLEIADSVEIDYLIVAGGGGGAGTSAGGRGGGGAGGVVSGSVTLATGAYEVTVGQGGSGGASGNNSGANGEPSIFETFTAIGGGGGGHLHTDGKAGGSGGGGGATTQSGGAGEPGQGHDGGNATGSTGGGGGGGAGNVGSNNVAAVGGNGGPGIASDLTGSEVWYAGGGGGGSYNNAGPSSGGIGGGGNGGQGNTEVGHGVANTGGGGGGAGDSGPGGNGGSGIVIVRYFPVTDNLAVSSLAATDIEAVSATANGVLISIADAENPHVYLCWGTADGGTAATGDWHQVHHLGNAWGVSEPFAHVLMPLNPQTTYSYRFYVTNSTGHAWSETRSFTTKALRTSVPLFTGDLYPAGSYVQVGTPDALQIENGETFTVEGWMRFDDLSVRDMLYSKNNGRGNPYSYMLGFADGNMAAYDGGNWRGNFNANRVTDQWYHLAFAYDGSQMTFYLDGESLGTAAYSFNNNVAHSIQVGGFGAPSDIKGMKSDVRVWNHARSQAQVQRHMQRRLVGVEHGLLGYWRLDEGQGSLVADGTVHTNDGTLSGASWTTIDDLSLETFAVVNPVNGNVHFTNTNTVDIALFPLYGGYHHYQITEHGALPDSEAWQLLSAIPADHTFEAPPTATNILLTAWFTNLNTAVTLISNTAEIVYTTVLPQPIVHPTLLYSLQEGLSTVTLTFDDIDNGTSGGEFDGTEMAFTYGLFCEDDVTPGEATVTLDTAGVYEVILTVTNVAVNIAAATSVVTVVARTESALYVSPHGDNSTGFDWQSAFHHPADALVYALPGDTIYLSGDIFALDAQLELNVTNLTLSGGYAATNQAGIPGEFDTRRWRTVLRRSPTSTNRLVSVAADNLIIERIEFRDGYANPGWGGGIRAADVSNLTISDCRFFYNIAYQAGGSYGRGGGLYLENVNGADIRHCLFHANESGGTTSGSRGGNLAISGGSASLFDVVVAAGTSRGSGGSYATGFGAGIWINGGSHTMTNLLVINNWINESNTRRGGGMQIESGSQVEIANATIYGNYPEGIRNYAGENLTIRNSILYGNTQNSSGGARDIINGNDGTGTPPTLFNNIIADGSGLGGNDNLDDDPRFEVPLFYLATHSPALDSGDRSVADAGLAGWTSSTNGATYAGTVNRGYHFAEGLGIDLELYVSPGGNDGNDGSGPEPANALRSVTRGLEIARDHELFDPRVRIHLAPGEYTTAAGEAFPLEVDGMTIQLAGTDAATTIIDAGGSATGQRVLVITDSWGDNRVEGVSIKGGYLNHGSREGGGVLVEVSALTIVSSVLRENIAVGPTYGYSWGGGLFAGESSLLIQDCIVQDNRAHGHRYPRGGGMVLRRGRTLLLDNMILDNESRNGESGAGGSRAGGLNVFGSVVMRNVLMTGNKATVRGREGNAIYMEGGDMLIENATIVTNINDIASGVAIHRAAGAVTLRNTILWDNVGDFNATNAIDIAYCLSDELDVGVNNNLIADPLFLAPDAGDFRLRGVTSGAAPSPAIDAGTNLWWMPGAVDLAGQPRILRGNPASLSPIVDMGAYETVAPMGSMFMFR